MWGINMTRHSNITATTKWQSLDSPQLSSRLMDFHYVVNGLLDYIDALPDDVVAKLPAMPGISRDDIERLLNGERF